MPALLALALIGSAAAPTGAGERTLQQRLVGSWQFVWSLNSRKDGSSFDRWGVDAKGIFVFDSDGHYAQIITNFDRLFGPRTVAAFGSYSVDEASKVIITTIEGSAYPKSVGTTQRRTIVSLTDTELRYINPVTASGTKVEALWRRFK